MKEACKAAIYRWASETDQINAALGLGDPAWVKLVITLYRDRYNHLIETGVEEWSDDEGIEEFLGKVKVGEMPNPIGG